MRNLLFAAAAVAALSLASPALADTAPTGCISPDEVHVQLGADVHKALPDDKVQSVIAWFNAQEPATSYAAASVVIYGHRGRPIILMVLFDAAGCAVKSPSGEIVGGPIAPRTLADLLGPGI